MIIPRRLLSTYFSLKIYISRLLGVAILKAVSILQKIYLLLHLRLDQRDLQSESKDHRIAAAIASPTLKFDAGCNYYVLDASYADKWLVLSFLGEHLEIYANSRIIASNTDGSLIEIFLGREVIAMHFIFVELEFLRGLTSVFTPASRLSAPILLPNSRLGCLHTSIPFALANGLPPGAIRHLHVVNYPYFSDLMVVHGVSYASLIKTILYLPCASSPRRPTHYKSHHYRRAQQLVSPNVESAGDKETSPPILFNCVNFSHQSLPLHLLVDILELLVARGYRVLLNIAQMPEAQRLLVAISSIPRVSPVIVDSSVLAIVCDQVYAVIGCLGGAMNIAVQFSNSHVLSLQTLANFLGCNDELILGPWAKEKMWLFYDRDWPCLKPGRIVENVYLGDVDGVNSKTVCSIVDQFLNSLPPFRFPANSM